MNKNKDGKYPDRSFIRLLRELYGQPSVDAYLKKFYEDTETKEPPDEKDVI